MIKPNWLRFVITGAPGSGKGTIGAWMVRDFKLNHLVAGDLIRAQIRAQTRKWIDFVDFVASKSVI